MRLNRLRVAAAALLGLLCATPGAPLLAQAPAQEAIKVHGDWTIEVRQPDGTLASRREFKNGLYGGASLLQQFLLRQLVPGGFEVFLGSSTSSPCRRGSGAIRACQLIEAGNPRLDGTDYPIFKTLTAAGGTGNSIVLSGTATALEAATITEVGTAIFACPANITVDVCATTPSGGDADFTRAVLATGIPVTAGQIIQVSVKLSFS
jgi:hypothetical protein